MATERVDVAVIGGGIYGSLAAVTAAGKGLRTVLVEAAPRLLDAASALNQARVHNGYHYPRSLATGARSHANYERFAAEFADSLVHHRSYYAIAARGSRVTARQFEQFCRVVGIPLEQADAEGLVDPRAVSGVWRVQESIFDANELRKEIGERLVDAGVEVRLGSRAEAFELVDEGARVHVGGEEIEAPLVLNCTYAGLERIPCGQARDLAPRLTYELAEIAVVRAPAGHENVGLTVMDGAFFSCIPLPFTGLHSLTHVRYTPHVAADAESFPWDALEQPPPTRFRQMWRAAEPIAPWLAAVEYVRSVWVVKAIPPHREQDDARPILVHRASTDSPVVSVLGSKLDNIYDFLAWLETSLP